MSTPTRTLGWLPDHALFCDAHYGKPCSCQAPTAPSPEPPEVAQARKAVIAAFNRWYEAKRTDDADSAINMFEVDIHRSLDAYASALTAAQQQEIERLRFAVRQQQNFSEGVMSALYETGAIHCPDPILPGETITSTAIRWLSKRAEAAEAELTRLRSETET